MFDCLTCGACCSTWDVIFKNNKGMLEKYYELHVSGNYIMKQDSNKRCVCLDGEVGQKVICKTYENRPETCVNFKNGEYNCLAARKKFNLTGPPIHQ